MMIYRTNTSVIERGDFRVVVVVQQREVVMDDRVIDGLPIRDSQFLNSVTDVRAIKTDVIRALMSYKSTKGSTLSWENRWTGISLSLDGTFGNSAEF